MDTHSATFQETETRLNTTNAQIPTTSKWHIQGTRVKKKSLYKDTYFHILPIT